MRQSVLPPQAVGLFGNEIDRRFAWQENESRRWEDVQIH